MKIELSIENLQKITENDVIAWDGSKWAIVHRDEFVKPYLLKLNKEIADHEKAIADLQESLGQFKASVNDKLEEHHRVLQILVKEDE